MVGVDDDMRRHNNNNNNKNNRSRRSVIPIREAHNYIATKVNLIGVVLEFSLPRKSRGTDYVSILKIVDDSQRNPELSVSIFIEKEQQLPHVKGDGDLIVLHDVLIEHFEDEVTARFNKKYSSFALFNGKVIDDFCCYQSYGNFSLMWSEKDILNHLRRWCSSTQLDSGKSDYLVAMSDISKGAYFDLVCKVLRVSFEVPKGLWILFVWDGTDAPPLGIDGKLNDEEHNALPLQIESSTLDQNILCEFPSLGTVLRVLADEVHENINQHLQGVGEWVRIRNMTSQISAGMWHGSLTSGSRLRLLDDKDSIVENYNSNFRKRKREHGRLPLWRNANSLTEIRFKTIQFATLMDIIVVQEDAIFGSIVRVVDIHPFLIDHLFSSNGTSEYNMRLTLEDPTARIHASLSGEDWVEFFGHVKSPEVMEAKLKSLLGVPEHQNLEDVAERSPPWVKCCIQTTKNNNDYGNRLYRLCCTKLANTGSEA